MYNNQKLELTRKLNDLSTVTPYIAEIIAPLKSLGVLGFFYVRFYKNGEFIDLTSQPDFAEHYFKKLFSSAYPVKALSDHIYLEHGVSLWELNQHNPIFQEAKEYFSYGNGVTFFDNHQTYKEIYSFYSAADRIDMSQFYLKNFDFFRKFKEFFVEKAKPLITQSEIKKFSMPKYYQSIQTLSENKNISNLLEYFETEINNFKKIGFVESKKNFLAPQQLACFVKLMEGKCLKIIASEMQLSTRTVEHYIEAIRKKLGCRSIKELIIKHGMGMFGS